MGRCRQNGRNIAAYYDDFNTIWSELYNSISLPCCPCGESNCGWDTRLIKQRNNDEKTRHFLIGLDHFYAAMRSYLLAKQHLPPLNKVYELLVPAPAGKRHLSADLLPSILSRLPVKSLMRFRCVAKSWLALVDKDAEFHSLHFDVFNKNCDKIKLLVVEGNSECSVRCSDTFELISEIPLNSPMEWMTVSSVNGLVLLESKSYRNKNALWNPSIRQIRYIPPHPPTDIHLANKVIGFGYDPLSKDYKVVKFVYVNSGLMHSVLVCSLGTGLWKTIPFQVQGFPCPIGDWNLAFTNSVYLHGSLHFVARDSLANPPRYLLSFHLTNEVFSWIKLPNVSHSFWPCDYKRGVKLVLIDGGSTLALYDNDMGDGAIWVLERENMSWTKRCRYALMNTDLLYGKKNGDMFTLRSHRETFTDETGRYNYLWRNEVALYCPHKRKYKILLAKKENSQWNWINHVFVFVESLKSC